MTAALAAITPAELQEKYDQLTDYAFRLLSELNGVQRDREDVRRELHGRLRRPVAG
jgi:hypothetical protein